MPEDEEFFLWLAKQVVDVDIPKRSAKPTYWKLLRALYTKEFVKVIANDDNRLADGKELRNDFIRETGQTSVDPVWMEMGCSTLELMVGLAQRLAFQAGEDPQHWFWRLIENIGLEKYNDRSDFDEVEVANTIDRVMYRQYHSNGRGGFFPLRNPPKNQKDQRKVELWYQMSSYVLEQLYET